MSDKTGVAEGFVAFGNATNEFNVLLIVIACLFGFIFLAGLVSQLVSSKKIHKINLSKNVNQNK